MPLLRLEPPQERLSAAELRRRIAAGGPALVALSGGVDSAVVAALAVDALGEEALAATVVGPAVAQEELAWSTRVARHLGITHEWVPADPLADVAYRANGPDRCYRCRTVEGGALAARAAERGIAQKLDGVHGDDLGEDRPGTRAMEEAGFRHPLLEGGWRKADVRAFATERGLPNADLPSNACLASRIATGETVTPELLAQVERAEAVVRGLGFGRVRVRVRESTARVEVDPEEVDRLFEPVTSAAVHRRLEELGFRAVDLDRAGYRRRASA
ncbi:MAG: ATP-dependent sacrificial sulfur transferase LarE [Thermoplasmata archaeon]|nr:ATP-dependent sacrificial sulfur transferase LarE [Thermoplasmata archaeon]